MYRYGDKTYDECSMGKLEEVQCSAVWMKDAREAKEEYIQNSGRVSVADVAHTWSTTNI